MWVELFRLLITDANRLSLYIYEVRPRSDTLARPPSLILFSLDPSLIVQLTTHPRLHWHLLHADNPRILPFRRRGGCPLSGIRLTKSPTNLVRNASHRSRRIERREKLARRLATGYERHAPSRGKRGRPIIHNAAKQGENYCRK